MPTPADSFKFYIYIYVFKKCVLKDFVNNENLLLLGEQKSLLVSISWL